MRHRSRSLPVLFVVGLLVLSGCTAGVGPTTGGTTDAPSEPTAVGEDGRAGTATDGASDAGGATSATNGTLTVHFINVGQGDSTLVVGPTGETMLVDTGDFRDDGEYVVDYLDSRGIDRIDYLVSTHADADHIGGNAAVIERFETEGEGVGAVYDPGVTASTATYDRYLDAVEQYDVPLYRTETGDEIPLAGATVSVLAPPRPPLADGDRNDNSVVLRLSFGETSVLLPGDAGAVEEPYLVDTHGRALDVTLLKAGHHGSSSSTSAEVLDATTPSAVVVSSAYDSRYGHPHEEVLGRLSARSIPTYWTGTHGTIVATSDGRTVTVATQAAASTRPLDLRADAPVAPDTRGPVVVRDAYAAADDGRADTDGQVDTGETAVELTEIHADAAGDDRTNLADEYVVLTNRGDSPVELSGWVLTDESGARYRFPDGVVLAPGDSITVRTGSGTDTETDRYWDAGRPVWNNDGDTVTLLRADGGVVTEVSY
ncbi:lamin tail domain-containing protein [Salinigranum marinum]|uniref:lamin tail domain-containing protein n=1 Tax=Salinigranum marinum TaxID=1515595 RepID=UPI002989B92E|nr:lamin tail domain-containing protein [Salinigranum marinum]